jgi:GST-like protein
MIDLYYWPTPNGQKILLFILEANLEYTIKPINIAKGEQFAPEFLKISPNNRIPAIVDLNPLDGGEAISIFESGAILQYLAQKTDQFLPQDLRSRIEVMQWLFWQMGGLGPMLGQNHHFQQYAPVKLPYAIERYLKETERLYDVLDKQLLKGEFITGDYSIADMATYPWIVPHAKQGQKLEDFPNVKRWFEAIQARLAVQDAYNIGQEVSSEQTVTDASRSILFGQRRRL